VSPVHRSAAIGFGRAAADYERGRPGYPPEAIDLLAEQLGLWGGRGPVRIIDLAAGTGKLTRALVGRGWQVVAVEPVPGMRAQLRAAVPGVEVVEGAAEHLPFRDGSVDAVFVAQAFHWFDVETAAAEIARVLVPGGGLGVIRNVWDRSIAWVDEVQSLIDERRTHEPMPASSRWRERLEQTERFSPLTEQVVRHVVESDRNALLARVSSISFIAMLPTAEREQLLTEVSEVPDRHDLGGPGTTLATPYETHVMWARRT
jgi:ubiquinone/menaquinone biosynthesis C-methylase UbiE